MKIGTIISFGSKINDIGLLGMEFVMLKVPN